MGPTSAAQEASAFCVQIFKALLFLLCVLLSPGCLYTGKQESNPPVVGPLSACSVSAVSKLYHACSGTMSGFPSSSLLYRKKD